MPRLLLNAADVYSYIRMFHLTQYGLDLIEDDSASDAMSMSSVTVFISTRWPSSAGNRVYPKQHRQVKNQRRLMGDLLESG
jgi:hypothetical protein